MAAPERSGSAEPKPKRLKTGSVSQLDGKAKADDVEAKGKEKDRAAKRGEASDNDEDDAGEDDKAGSGAEDQAAAPTGLAGWKGFCTAFASIMARALDKPDAPVLCETEAEQKIMEIKKEMKEKKLHALQAKGLKNQGHTVPDITKKAFEAQLRKVATEGVVRLFNAVKDFRDHQLDQSAKAKTRAAPLGQKSKLLADFSKEAFEEKWKRRSSREIRLQKEAEQEALEKKKQRGPKEIRLQRIAAREAKKEGKKPDVTRELDQLEEFG